MGDIGTLKNGMNFSKEAMGHGYAFVNLQNIFGNNVIDNHNLEFAEASEKQLIDYSLQKGDVLFVRSSVKLEGVGEAALIPENLENTTYSGFLIRFRDEYGLNNNFKKFIFAIRQVRNQIMSQATNSANKNISQSVLENLTFNIPIKEEQRVIGQYFSELDNLITLHQRKLEKLKTFKKAMLDKMFPKNGELVPEIRFSGFTDPWEQCKLKDFADYKSSSLTAKDCKEEGKYDLYDANQIIGKTDNFVIDKDYITIIKDGAGVGRTRKLPKNTAFIGTMGALTVNNSDLDFLYATLNRIDWNTKTSGSTIPHIYFKDYGEEVYGAPSIEEQKKIGLYFKNIDYLITLHQRKLEKLQNLKKSMLNKMFI